MHHVLAEDSHHVMEEDSLFKEKSVLYECGTYNIFLPGSEVPGSWWTNNKSMGCSLTFNVPSLSNHKIQALKIYIVFGYFPGNPAFQFPYGYNYIRVSNKTKRLKWAYIPWFHFTFPDDDNDRKLVWLSYWKMGNQLILEAGDEVNVSVGSTFDKKCLVNEIGVEIVYDEREDKGSQHRKTYSSHQDVTPVGDLSRYQVIPGQYLLSNSGYPAIYYIDEDDPVKTIFGGFSDFEDDTAGSDEEYGCSDEESGRSDKESSCSDEESGRSDEESAWLADEESARLADKESARLADEESGRSDEESARLADKESGRSDEESALLADEESGRSNEE